MAPLSNQQFKAFIGIDWADTKHDICLQQAGDDRREFDCIPHQVTRIDEWAKALYQRFGGPIAIPLELARGPSGLGNEEHQKAVVRQHRRLLPIIMTWVVVGSINKSASLLGTLPGQFLSSGRRNSLIEGKHAPVPIVVVRVFTSVIFPSLKKMRGHAPLLFREHPQPLLRPA